MSGKNCIDRIKELEGEVAGVREDLLDLRQQTNIRCSQVQERDTKIYELQANNHDLREALEGMDKISISPYDVIKARKALSSTPAESLQAHDDEVIEKCAKAVTIYGEQGEYIANAIRALKGK